MALTVEIAWRSVGGVHLVDEDLQMPDLPKEPGVYKWHLSAGGAHREYVGEATDLFRRFQHYRMPGRTEDTNTKMNERCRRVLAAGGSIEILLADVILRSGSDAVEPDLSSKFVRCFVENAALVELLLDEGEIVNGKGFGTHRHHEVLR